MENFSNILTYDEIEEIKALAPKLAEEIQKKANKAIRINERLQAKEFSRMVSDPKSRAVFMTIVDQVFRLSKDSAILKKFIDLLNEHGVPSFFGPVEKFSLKVLKLFGPFIPGFLATPVVWSILTVMRFKTRNVILPSEQRPLNDYFEKCKKENLKININHLGDMVLGKREEQRHLENYLKELENPDVSCISVKISTLFSQVDVVASEHTITNVMERLETLLIAAKKAEKEFGTPKLIYLDMEEYKDLILTVEIFTKFLENPKFDSFTLGIALQAYIPDSFVYQQKLTRLAKARLSKGGAPIRIRIVKGANMEMEKCIASVNDWEQAPYTQKVDTDANFKRMTAYAFQPENLKAVKIGIGSHNIFEIAFAKILQTKRGLDPSCFDFEMLEGIANHTRRSVQELIGPVLTYTPVTSESEFLNAIAYLVRRLMENTDKENFLSNSFDLDVGTKEWNVELEKFQLALNKVSTLESPAPRHKQDRKLAHFLEDEKTPEVEMFTPNSPTNFALPENQEWLKNEILRDDLILNDFPKFVPLKIGGKYFYDKRSLLPSRDLSGEGKVVARFLGANSDDINNAIDFSSDTEDSRWDNDETYRLNILESVATTIEKNRGSLILNGMKNVAKGITEVDAEVSEAIDFVRYYSSAFKHFRDSFPEIDFKKKGTVLVVSPWNFPIAIPTGGIAAALVMGNRVIIKPSPYSLWATWKVVKLFWKAGVPEHVLQFVPCEDKEAHHLTRHPKIKKVVFTGSGKTAEKIMKGRPSLDFSGETSGKNVLIVTDSADKELAIKHLVESAYGFNGQKCSAASLAILTKEVYADPKFKLQLKDAVESLPVGVLESQPQNKITPLITFPKKELLRALTQLDAGEEWVVQPKEYETANLWSPGLRWGVQPGSFMHLTELFGPVLGIMMANDLKHACELANQTEYGLTAGLHSLDEKEIDYFTENMKAGNLYINSKTTGAIVGRQPFGGIKNSCRGAGGKAGGINYILQFATIEEVESRKLEKFNFMDSSLESLISFWEENIWSGNFRAFENEAIRAIQGVRKCLNQQSVYFSREHSLSKAQQVIGQTNTFRYRKIGKYAIRVSPEDFLSDILLRLMAGIIAGNQIEISIPTEMKGNEIVSFLESHSLKEIQNKFSMIFESDKELCQRILEKSIGRLAYSSPDCVPLEVYTVANEVNLPIFRNKPVVEGRYLMLEQYYEQTISNTYHRYGNPGLKQFELPDPKAIPFHNMGVDCRTEREVKQNLNHSVAVCMEVPIVR